METTKTTQNPAFKTLLQGLQMEDALDRLEVSLEAVKQERRKAQQAAKEAQLEAEIAKQETGFIFSDKSSNNISNKGKSYFFIRII